MGIITNPNGLVNNDVDLMGISSVNVASRKETYMNWLVVSTSLKNMKVSWDDYSQLNGKIKKSSKPPTSEGL